MSFVGDPVPDTDSGSLFAHCKIGNFIRFISISHTATGRFLPRDAMHHHFIVINDLTERKTIHVEKKEKEKKLLVTVFIHHTCDKITDREVSRMIGQLE